MTCTRIMTRIIINLTSLEALNDKEYLVKEIVLFRNLYKQKRLLQ
jgi:hypothetical protein